LVFLRLISVVEHNGDERFGFKLSG
jgi:hypothetical protein